jgi:hypothetical protein
MTEAAPILRTHRGRIGVIGFVAVLASLRDGPTTVMELARRLDVHWTMLYRIVPTFYVLGRLHVAGWQPCRRRGWFMPIYGYGGGPDAPPIGHHRPLPVKPRMVTDVIAVESALRCLETPSTKVELMEACGLSHKTAKLLIEACIEHGLAHIDSWTARSLTGAGQQLPQYIIGPGAPKPKPRRASKKEINKRWYYRNKETAKAAPLARVFGAAGNAGTFNLTAGMK